MDYITVNEIMMIYSSSGSLTNITESYLKNSKTWAKGIHSFVILTLGKSTNLTPEKTSAVFWHGEKSVFSVSS